MATELMQDGFVINTQKDRKYLNWVGICEISLPLQFPTRDGDVTYTVAKTQIYINTVDTNSSSTDIIRSELHQILDTSALKTLTINGLQDLLTRIIKHEKNVILSARVDFMFNYLSRRPSLKSSYSGWKSYPTRVVALQEQEQENISLELHCEIPYSSTCPCSAALARQLIQKQFSVDFKIYANLPSESVYNWLSTERGIVATPHSQRSIAVVKVKLRENVESLPIDELIDLIEDCLKTPVQTAVKREDEQEFARLNGQNPMFCEDASRKIRLALLEQNQFTDFKVHVNHLESLHAHNAVGIVVKGNTDGFAPNP